MCWPCVSLLRILVFCLSRILPNSHSTPPTGLTRMPVIAGWQTIYSQSLRARGAHSCTPSGWIWFRLVNMWRKATLKSERIFSKKSKDSFLGHSRAYSLALHRRRDRGNGEVTNASAPHTGLGEEGIHVSCLGWLSCYVREKFCRNHLNQPWLCLWNHSKNLTAEKVIKWIRQKALNVYTIMDSQTFLAAAYSAL